MHEPTDGGPASGLETLPPSYFALVMATGIVSIACQLLGLEPIARALLALNVLAFVTLWALYVLRALRYPSDVLRDVADHARGVGYFTVVAGTCVLGTQLVVVVHFPGIARALWVFATVLHFLLIYAVFTALTTKREKPSLERGINGAWLVAVVATQGVSVLGGNVWQQFPGLEREVLFFTLAMWLGGGMIYVWLISLIFYRYLFFELEPSDLGPPYWIDMGAMAISTLAGDVLIANAGHDQLLAELLPFLKGVTLLFWATASWWIPMLLLLGYWRHVIRRFPLRYDPGYWGMVFPLGMYTAATYKLALSIDAPFLLFVPHAFLWCALAVWAIVVVGLVRTVVRALRQGSRVRHVSQGGLPSR